MKYIVDSSAIITELVHDIVELSDFETKIAELLRYTPSTDLIIPNFIFTETQITLTRSISLKYKFNEKTQLGLLERFKVFYEISNIYSPDLNENLDMRDFFLSLSEKEIINHKLSLADIGLMIIALGQDAEILTCDKKLLSTFSRLKVAN
jgi:predicted nucleic acid-binding protein